MTPQPFGRYLLLFPLARSGTAELYLARCTWRSTVGGAAGGGSRGGERGGDGQAERLVVIKRLRDRLLADRTFLEMFQDEARIATRLAHPNINRVHEVGRVVGQLYLALELVHGQTLWSVIRRRRQLGGRTVPPAIAALIGARVCAGLHHAHTARGARGRPLYIVHRDVSLSNIMIGYDGRVQLLDFGIARAADRLTCTWPGLIKGKVQYLSPEQIAGLDLDARSDIFSTAICVWETAMGRHLFTGADDEAVLRAILGGHVRRPSSVLPAFPPALEQILLQALAHDPQQRHATALQLGQELESFAREAGLAGEDAELAVLMQETFSAEISAWEEARARGISLADHLAACHGAASVSETSSSLPSFVAGGDADFAPADLTTRRLVAHLRSDPVLAPERPVLTARQDGLGKEEPDAGKKPAEGREQQRGQRKAGQGRDEKRDQGGDQQVERREEQGAESGLVSAQERADQAQKWTRGADLRERHAAAPVPPASARPSPAAAPLASQQCRPESRRPGAGSSGRWLAALPVALILGLVAALAIALFSRGPVPLPSGREASLEAVSASAAADGACLDGGSSLGHDWGKERRDSR